MLGNKTDNGWLMTTSNAGCWSGATAPLSKSIEQGASERANARLAVSRDRLSMGP